MGTWGPRTPSVDAVFPARGRACPLFSLHFEAPFFLGHNTVNKAGLRAGGTFMLCVGQKEGCLRPQASRQGVHMTKGTLLGRGRGFWDFLRKWFNRQPLPSEQALRECGSGRVGLGPWAGQLLGKPAPAPTPRPSPLAHLQAVAPSSWVGPSCGPEGLGPGPATGMGEPET